MHVYIFSASNKLVKLIHYTIYVLVARVYTRYQCTRIYKMPCSINSRSQQYLLEGVLSFKLGAWGCWEGIISFPNRKPAALNPSIPGIETSLNYGSPARFASCLCYLLSLSLLSHQILMLFAFVSHSWQRWWYPSTSVNCSPTPVLLLQVAAFQHSMCGVATGLLDI